MPRLTQLKIQNFRNLNNVDIEISSNFNIFYGRNGAGKTSLLEAIYYLGLGRSFRSSPLRSIINYTADRFSIFILLKTDTDSFSLTAGIERSYNGGRHIKLEGETILTLSQIAKRLPLQLITATSYRFFYDGPRMRRSFMDWLAFHVKPTFFSVWKTLQRVLKQRNSALKKNRPYDQISFWNNELVSIARQIDQFRSEIIVVLQPILLKLLALLLPKYEFQLQYERGWKPGEEYALLLNSSITRDIERGHTQWGPHKADLRLMCNEKPAQDILSQGQQKLAAYAFYLAQGQLYKQETQQTPIYLIDDIASELDAEKQICVIEALKQLHSQVCITGILSDELKKIISLTHGTRFHIKHGAIVMD